jgi:hypothetical protein
MLLDAAHARLELADQHAVAEHGGVIFDHRPAQPDDLFARFPSNRVDPGVHGDEIRRNVGAERTDFRLQSIFDARDVGADVAQQFEHKVFRRWTQRNSPPSRPSAKCASLRPLPSRPVIERE